MNQTMAVFPPGQVTILDVWLTNQELNTGRCQSSARVASLLLYFLMSHPFVGKASHEDCWSIFQGHTTGCQSLRLFRASVVGQNRAFLPFGTEFCLKTTQSGIVCPDKLEKVANKLSDIHIYMLESVVSKFAPYGGENVCKLRNSCHFRCNYGWEPLNR